MSATAAARDGLQHLGASVGMGPLPPTINGSGVSSAVISAHRLKPRRPR